MKMPSPVSQFVVNSCCKNVIVREKTSHSKSQIDNPAYAKTNTACLEELLLCSAVDGHTQTPLPTFVVCVIRSLGMVAQVCILYFAS
jgi:hypothetical protein